MIDGNVKIIDKVENYKNVHICSDTSTKNKCIVKVSDINGKENMKFIKNEIYLYEYLQRESIGVNDNYICPKKIFSGVFDKNNILFSAIVLEMKGITLSNYKKILKFF